jgi:uncharacterized protein YjbI with pentapeptide repeats
MDQRAPQPTHGDSAAARHVDWRWPGAAILALGVLVVLVLFCFAWYPKRAYPDLTSVDLKNVTDQAKVEDLKLAQGKLQNDARTTAMQGLAAFLLLIGAGIGGYMTLRQVRATREQIQNNEKAAEETARANRAQLEQSQQGQVTDRYAKSVELLSEEGKLQARLGGIYALERLMVDSPRDQPTILEVLAAYVRERTAWLDPIPLHPATDVQAALTVIGRRSPAKDERPIDLTEAHLDGVRLMEAHLEGARLTEAHLERANLDEAHLEGAELIRAHLERARLDRAHLDGARLIEAHLEGAHLKEAHFEEACLNWAHLKYAELYEAHLKNAELYEAHLDGARLSGAHLDGANLNGANLNEAHLEGAELIRAHLERARLDRAHLDGARLIGAHLESARLTGAHLDGARLNGAHLDRTDLEGALGLTQSQVDDAIVDETTKLPADLHMPGEGLAQPDRPADHQQREGEDQ